MTIYKTLKDEAFKNGLTPKSDQAREWYRNKAKNLFTVDRQAAYRDTRKESSSLRRFMPGKFKFTPGAMFMFFYDAKHKDTLPYWDKFPLIVALDYAQGGFTGLNLHYLPFEPRAKLMDALMEITNNKRYDNSTRIKASYKLLAASSKYKEFQPCFKRYLFSQMRSQFAMVNAEDWEIAAFLPVAHWQKKNQWQIYSETRRKLSNG